ncbi:uncharacterized protein EV154DRAFT_578518 [Mucor mucedo]|uniref:uncharacterized protein n=1 Tax=Mucor mucedo TaxID=29922 RepID=UPI00222103EF|nr:uncharacterized protein EV154DRAFT_578518 [Mucor mucedo]KAI7873941.1 hypothetical protein EV154DRAFT_578518 [Mucor mucedo]
MKSLPCSIVQTIASYLSFKDKLNCILVCRQWHLWIRNSCLYETLSFQTNSDSLSAALEFFNRHSLFGSRVHSLSMIHCHLQDKTANCITRVLPNIQTLVWIESDEHGRSQLRWVNIGISFRFYRWKKIKYLTIDATTFHTFNLLGLAAPLNQLDTLIIYFNTIEETQRDLARTMAYKLRYAQSLQLLVLKSAVVDLSIMEEIHINAPDLKELVLEDVTLLMDHKLNNRAIVHAKALRKLHMDVINDPKDLLQNDQVISIRHWLNYFASKYRHVEDILIIAQSSFKSLSPCVADLLRAMRHITRYAIQLCSIDPTILRAIHSFSLSSLSIWINRENAGEQITTLASWNTLPLHLQSFDIVVQDLLPLDPLNALIDLIMNLSHLKSLSIQNVAIKNETLPLILLLNEHPSLTFIYLDHGTVRDMTFEVTVKKRVGLHSLTLHLCTYTLGNHSSANDAIRVIMSKQTLPFHLIRIKGDVICGVGMLRIPLTKAPHLHKLNIQLDMIGYISIYKTSENEYIASNNKTKELLKVSEMKKIDGDAIIPREWTYGQLTTVRLQI